MPSTTSLSGASPSKRLSVERNIPMPATAIKIATTSPITPSRSTDVKCDMINATMTARVAAESLMLSVAVALSAGDEIFLASNRLKKNIHSLTSTDAARTTIVAIENSLSSGVISLPTDSIASSTATTSTMNATIIAAIYSILWCPYGCSLSAGFSATLNPITDTTLLPQSVRLLKPSAVTDSAPNSVPTTILPTASKMLSTMPTAPASVPYAARTRGESTSSASLTNNLIKSLPILHRYDSMPKLYHARTHMTRFGGIIYAKKWRYAPAAADALFAFALCILLHLRTRARNFRSRQIGISTIKVEPCPSLLSSLTVPDSRCAACLTIASPSPVPPLLRERALSTR